MIAASSQYRRGSAAGGPDLADQCEFHLPDEDRAVALVKWTCSLCGCQAELIRFTRWPAQDQSGQIRFAVRCLNRDCENATYESRIADNASDACRIWALMRKLAE